MPNWKEILNEVNRSRLSHLTKAHTQIDIIRRKYLKKLYEKTGRNIIAYYSGWLSKPDFPSWITDEDKNGFMMCIHKLDKSQGLDLILHTPGGDIAATESLVDYLRKIFGKNIRAIIPQIAMSAGTMIACSCKEIWMSKHSNLGPIDPQINNMPAQGVVEEFKRAYEEIKLDPNKANVWYPILNKYHPSFLTQCEKAIEWSKSFVRFQLETVMFDKEAQAAKKAERIVEALTNYNENKTHSKHIPMDKCQELGLAVKAVEDDQEFQDLLLTVHHCYMHSLMNTPAYKIIENHLGACLAKAGQIAPNQEAIRN